jgi:hypothetical protein
METYSYGVTVGSPLPSLNAVLRRGIPNCGYADRETPEEQDILFKQPCLVRCSQFPAARTTGTLTFTVSHKATFAVPIIKALLRLSYSRPSSALHRSDSLSLQLRSE